MAISTSLPRHGHQYLRLQCNIDDAVIITHLHHLLICRLVSGIRHHRRHHGVLACWIEWHDPASGPYQPQIGMYLMKNPQRGDRGRVTATNAHLLLKLDMNMVADTMLRMGRERPLALLFGIMPPNLNRCRNTILDLGRRLRRLRFEMAGRYAFVGVRAIVVHMIHSQKNITRHRLLNPDIDNGNARTPTVSLICMAQLLVLRRLRHWPPGWTSMAHMYQSNPFSDANHSKSLPTPLY